MVSADPDQLDVTTTNRSPSSSSWCEPLGSSGSATTSASATETIRSPSVFATYTYSPSVSTMSPSSTPISWVFVPENSPPAVWVGAGAASRVLMRRPTPPPRDRPRRSTSRLRGPMRSLVRWPRSACSRAGPDSPRRTRVGRRIPGGGPSVRVRRWSPVRSTASPGTTESSSHSLSSRRYCTQ